MFDHASFDGHERLLTVQDRKTGLRAMIAVHSTALGPAAGGCRLWAYDSHAQALDDVLRLSKGMSFKNAVAGLPLGGGKAVIFGPIDPERRADAFHAFGEAVESLGGRYITAEDVGVGEDDMRAVATATRYVSGISAAPGEAGGNPSPYTARGILRGIEATAAVHLGRNDLDGVSIAVQGLGQVGSHLCQLLAERGARLTVADIDAKRVEAMQDTCHAQAASTDSILLADVDVVAPCALGGAITPDIAGRLRATAIAGGANNQLRDETAAQILLERGIAYAPDYVINAGGIIAAAAEYLGGSSEADVFARIDSIRDRTAGILERARREKISSHLIADAMAREAIAKAV